jgi:cyclase
MVIASITILDAAPAPVIASGGAGSLEQIAEALLPSAANADAALVASMPHFGKTAIGAIKKYVEEKGVTVRW